MTVGRRLFIQELLGYIRSGKKQSIEYVVDADCHLGCCKGLKGRISCFLVKLNF